MQSKTPAATIKIPKPHSPGQREILEWQGHGVAFCGRRYGKTQIAVLKMILSASRDPGLYWWVGLTWRSASMKRAWRLLKKYIRDLWAAIGERSDEHIRESEKELHLPGGGEIWLRTAERPDSLAGEGIKGVVLDEFPLMAEAVWTEFIAPTLLDYGGWALFVGVPKGRNWAFQLWNAAKTRPGWRSWQFSSYDNPKLQKERIDELVRDMTQRLVDQEIYALVIDDSGAVFRNVALLATATAQEEAIPGHVYCAGIDWARLHDATVFSVVDITLQQLVYMDRMTGTDYELQVSRLKALHERFRPTTILAESNAMGSPLIERLQRDGLPVVAFTTTNSTKQAIIDALTMAFERQTIAILPDETLIAELQAFEATQLPSGLVRYAAPGSMHDDCVMSLAMAWQGAHRIPAHQLVDFIELNF